MKSIVKISGSFDKVLISCKSIGERYQPTAPSLSITALTGMSDRSQQSTQAVILTRAAYRMAVFNRRESFAGIPKLSVRIVNLLAVSGTTEEVLEGANNLKKQLHQAPRKRKVSNQMTTEGSSFLAKRAANRKHFEMRTETFTALVRIVEQVATYAPNECDLKVDALKRKVDELLSKSREVETTAIAFSKARIERHHLVFGPQGVDETIQAVKRYIRGAFGVNSVETRQIADAS